VSEGVRPATVADAPALGALQMAALLAGYAEFLESTAALPGVAERVSWWRAELGQPDALAQRQRFALGPRTRCPFPCEGKSRPHRVGDEVLEARRVFGRCLERRRCPEQNGLRAGCASELVGLFPRFVGPSRAFEVSHRRMIGRGSRHLLVPRIATSMREDVPADERDPATIGEFLHFGAGREIGEVFADLEMVHRQSIGDPRWNAHENAVGLDHRFTRAIQA